VVASHTSAAVTRMNRRAMQTIFFSGRMAYKSGQKGCRLTGLLLKINPEIFIQNGCDLFSDRQMDFLRDIQSNYSAFS